MRIQEKYAGLAQLVRASALQAGGRRFESVTPHHMRFLAERSYAGVVQRLVQ